MAGTTNNFSSNIQLALSAAPQGVYDPRQQGDIDGNFAATQQLSQITSDAVTTRILFLVGVPAGRFIKADISAGNEAIGVVASSGDIPIGFLSEDVKPGEYGIVYSQGINKFFSGLTPGRSYAVTTPGVVVPTFGLPFTYTQIGFAMDANTLRVLPPVLVYMP